MDKFTAKMVMATPVRSPYGAIVSLYPSYNDPEDNAWAQATPAGQVVLNVSNEFADQLETGKYLITFERVPDEAPVTPTDAPATPTDEAVAPTTTPSVAAPEAPTIADHADAVQAPVDEPAAESATDPAPAPEANA